MKWSKEQDDVIKSVNSNTLVAASAGSGKTAVMVERLSRLVGGDKKQEVKRIMLVTFTNEVAAELKTKIAKMLKKQIENGDGDKEHLTRQLDSLPMCEISTFHSMCGNLIKTHFEEVNIDPSFAIIEDDTAKLLFANAVDEVLQEYEAELNQRLMTLVKYFGSRRELKSKIQKFYLFVMAQRDREKFVDKTVTYCQDTPIEDNQLVVEFVENVNSFVNLAIAKLREFELVFVRNKMDKHLDIVRLAQSYFKGYENFGNLEEALKFFGRQFEFGRLPNSNCYKDDVCGDIAVDFAVWWNDFKDEFKSWIQLGTTDIATFENEAKNQKPYVELMRDIVKKAVDKYGKAKKNENKMDFNDLEYYAVKLLENDEIAKEVSQQFDFVCIDEYQDTNGVQEYIIGRIANGHNLFMVGDSKQSIYQFRMTDPDIFLNKYNDFVTKKQEGEAFLLNTNYRSSKDVLEFVNRLFDKIMTTKFGGINYASSSRLECGSQGYEASVDKPVEVARFCKEDDLSQLNLPKDGVYSVREDVLSASDTDLSEALYVAEKIASLVGEKDICELDAEQKPVFRKIRYSDIAILCKTRSNKVVGILNYLKSINIPVDSSNLVKKETNFCISLVVDFVSVVNNFRQDFPLINVMSSPIGGFSLTELAKIKNMTESKYFFEAFVWARQNENELQEKCMALWTLIERYRDMSFCVGVDELMKNIITESDLDEYVVAKDGGAQSLQQLMTFVENLKNKNYNNSLPAFLAVADNLDDIAEAQTVGVGQENCIKAITIHASKGMEYPIVFVVDAAHCFNNEETKEKIIFDKDYGALVRVFDEDDGVYGKGLLWQLLLDYKAKKDKEEQMRLMYVALTRAKNMLFVSATKKRTKEETPREFEKASSFFDWIWAVCCKDKNFFCDYYVEPSFEKKDFELNAPLSFKFENPPIELVEQLDKWQQRNYEFELSTKLGIKYTVTEINNNVTQEVVCGKKVNNPAIAYAKDCKSDEIGTAYHKALECIDFGIKGETEVGAALDKMVEDGELKIEQRKMICDKLIAQCLDNEIFENAKNGQCLREKEFLLYVEAKEIVDVELSDKVLLQGTIDLLIVGKQNILIDFKLSEQPVEYIAKKYEKQLQLYQLAAESCLGIKVDRKVIIVVGRNEVIEM